MLATMIAAPSSAAPASPVTPASVLAAAPDADWANVDPHDLLVIDLAANGRVVILLADRFAPVHVGNIRKLAAARSYSGGGDFTIPAGSGFLPSGSPHWTT